MTLPLSGYIYFDKKFEFEDGTIGEKLFIVLCDSPKDKSNVLAARTTKQPKSEPVYGCHFPSRFETVFFVSKSDSDFDLDTWILFDYLVEYKSDILESWHLTGKLSIEQSKSLLLCGCQSDTIAGWQKEALKELGDLITI